MRQSEALQILEQKISKCTLCADLSQYRSDNEYLTVPGEGRPNAQVMIVGEAPGQNEAKQGSPFVGKAGKLLDGIIEACGWTRSEVFIANILKCRPPGNRDPLPEEATNCRTYLNMQIKIINPKWILCFGKVASINLLGRTPDTPMRALRGDVYEHEGRKVICTYHPSYLLRNPAAKKDVWEDLQPCLRDLSSK